MTRTVAILGAGETGRRWKQDFLTAGWRVRLFDPDPDAPGFQDMTGDCRRVGTISGSVGDADWIVVAVPDRLELIQKVVQRAQAVATKEAVIAVTSRAYDIDALQGCGLRPGNIIRVLHDAEGGFDLHVRRRNDDGFRKKAVLALSELSAVRCLGVPDEAPDQDDAASA